MAYDLESGMGADLPVGDRYYGPAEWAGQGGGRDGDFERGYLRGSFEGGRSLYTSEGYRGTNLDTFQDQRRLRALVARGPYAGRGPRSYERSRERILEDVNEALTRDPDLDATDIEVEVEDGEVTLRGSVKTREDRRHAEDVAAAVAGVRDVHNRIQAPRR